MFWPSVVGFFTHPIAWFNPQVIRSAYSRLSALLNSTKERKDPKIPQPAYSLVSIAINPHFRGQGIGQVLMQAFEAEARARGAVALRLSTRPNNSAAIALYNSCGWQNVPNHRGLYFFKILS
jgi:ribosomal protein S18 acetylase RimI-like enzyme